MRWIPHKPEPKQRAFLEYDGLEAMYGGAAGGGKSDALLMAALQYVDVPGYSAIIFRRTFTDLSLPGALMDRAREWLGPTAARWNENKKQWRFPSGAVLQFGFMERDADRTRYRSAEFQYCAFDELTDFPTDVPYRFLFSRLRRTAGVDVPLRMRAATNPGGRGHRWVAKRYAIAKTGRQDPAKATDPHTKQLRLFVPASLIDNPHVDEESYRSSLAQLDQTTRDQLEKGLWIEDGQGLIYPYSADNLVEVAPSHPGDWYFILGADLGASQAKPTTAYAVCCWNQQVPDVVWVLQSHKSAGDTPTSIARTMQQLNAHFGGFAQIVEDEGALGKGYGKEFRERYALPVQAAEKGSKLAYRKLLRGALEDGKIQIVESTNAELLEEMESLIWDEHGLDNEAHADNHLTDALLYAWRACKAHAAELPEPEPDPGSPEWYAREERRLEEADEADAVSSAVQPWFRRR